MSLILSYKLPLDAGIERRRGKEEEEEEKIGQDENGEYEMKIALTVECVLHASPEARGESVGEVDKRMLLGWVSGSVCPSRARVPAKLCLHCGSLPDGDRRWGMQQLSVRHRRITLAFFLCRFAAFAYIATRFIGLFPLFSMVNS